MKRRKGMAVLSTLLSLCMAFSGVTPVCAAETEEPAETKATYVVSEDTENKEAYGDLEEGVAAEFDWYRWDFAIDPEIDTVGEVGDGIGTLYFRLFTPETKEGEEYPMMLYLGGLGSTNSNSSTYNGYAAVGVKYASDVMQAENPSYVVTFSTPYEACVNYEAELAYVYQYGEIAKWIAEEYGNVDMNRIYASGHSQGAGWSYELAAVQPDLLAGALINAGTTIHTTWGDQCDMEALAASDVNLYIWHGYSDPFIPVNEAYRAYNTLKKLGKTNMVMEIANTDDISTWIGHVNVDMASDTEITPYMAWLYQQVKGVPCTEEPQLQEDDDYSVYKWAGYLVFPTIENWTTANDYANWVEPAENETWNQVKAASNAYVSGKGGTGDTYLAKIRIGDETSTQYDDSVQNITAGDTVAVTVQGYTGGYGDDWEAFNEEWSVDWAVLAGDVTNVELTHEASAEPIVRPASVTLANGGGPNVNNSLYTENALDGNQVYVKIDTAEGFSGSELKVAIRFTRKVGDEGEYASYYHVVSYTVQQKATIKTTVKSTVTKTYGDKAFTLGAATNSDAKLKYKSSNNNVASVSSKGKVTIHGTGIAKLTVYTAETDSYTAAKKVITLQVKPKKASISKVTAGKKAVTVKVKKDTRATGYQVQVSTSKKFTKSKTKTVTLTKKTSVTAQVKKLTTGKTYYVRVRSYKTSGSKKLYSAYSAIKSVKVK